MNACAPPAAEASSSTMQLGVLLLDGISKFTCSVLLVYVCKHI